MLCMRVRSTLPRLCSRFSTWSTYSMAVLEVTVAQVIMGEDHPVQALASLAVCLYIAGM